MVGEKSPAAPLSVSRKAVRIVLFGMPNAGKTSLLGALAQAAKTQQQVLNGRLSDLGNGLTQLQQQLYEGAPPATPGEVALYPVLFEPASADEAAPTAGWKAVLADTDGLAANELLARRRLLGYQ